MAIQEFTLYPNPSNGQNVQMILDPSVYSAQVELNNISGQVIVNQLIDNTIKTLNLTSLEKGLYIAKVIYVDGSHQVKKLLIQ